MWSILAEAYFERVLKGYRCFMSLNVSVMQLSGVFDGTKSGAFHGEIRQALDANADVVLIDCQALGFMDSSGLGAMIVALKMIRGAGKLLCLCSVNKQVGMLLDLTDTRRVFQIFVDRAEFEQQMLNQSSS
jgi:anti-sigma B factor antagonist